MNNKVICGDCLNVLKTMPSESIDLIYLDPPFHSGTNYDAIWNNGYEITHFKDKAWQWYSKDGKRVTGIHAYLGWLEERVRECHRVLKSTGSLYLHCDWHANAHIRLMLDKIFGEKNFQNEIVWRYKRGASQSRYTHAHDTIFYYVKSRNYTYHAEEVKEYYDRKPSLKDRKGGMDERGYYRYSYLDDNWIDIPGVFNLSKEHLGYPTQKPEKLLERIIKASSNEGDIVLDPMSGGGTTVAVAHRLNRRWIGIDISPTACRVMMERLNKLGVNIKEADIIGYPMKPSELKELSPLEFENYVRRKLHAFKPKPDEGIDAITNDGFEGIPPNVKKIAVQIKRQENVGRAIVDALRGAIEICDKYPISKKYGIIVGFSFTRNAIERTAEFRRKFGIDIRLMDVKELIKYEHKGGLERWM